MGRKVKRGETPQINPELVGFDIKINEFGEIVSTIEIGKLNEFLDRNVDDKKFRGVEVVKRLEDETDVSKDEMDEVGETDN